MAAPFVQPSRLGSSWFFAGLTSSFPDVSLQDGSLSKPYHCNDDLRPACKAFRVSRSDGSQAVPLELEDVISSGDLKDQVLVFQHRGKFHAIDHQCPHSSYSLSRGSVFDIEDFGIVLSSGITCPKHGWSFDLHAGQADRGLYKLAVWEVQLRPLSDLRRVGASKEAQEEQELWVRRKQRIG